jgi:hypothetical protein
MQREEREAQIKIELSPRTRALSIAGVAVAVVIALLDFVVLRGDVVARVSVDLRDEEPTFVELTRLGEPHLVEIRATRRVKGETRGRNVDYRIVDPNGNVVVDESEFVQRKDRYVRFTPMVAGNYAISVHDGGGYLRGNTSHRTATVKVLVNDRRILPRLLPF